MRAIFKNTPIEIIVQILEYSGAAIKFRNGEFVDQIANDDERYNLLQTISPVKTKLFNGVPWRYTRDLGKYHAYLHIDNAYYPPKYRIVFSKKREEGDTSSIVLYYHKIK